MASLKNAKARIKGPYGLASDWERNPRVLLAGEKVYAKVSNGDVRSKTGDGAKTFHELPYDDEALYESLGKKVAMNQGVEHAGKVLGIGDDGTVKPIDNASGGGAKTWGDLAGKAG